MSTVLTRQRVMSAAGLAMVVASACIVWYTARRPKPIEAQTVDVLTSLFSGDSHALDGHMLPLELHTLGLTQQQVDQLVGGFVTPRLKRVKLAHVTRSFTQAGGGQGIAQVELTLPSGKQGYAGLALYKADDGDILRITDVVELVWRVEAMVGSDNGTPDPLSAMYNGTKRDRQTLEANGLRGLTKADDPATLLSWDSLEARGKALLDAREAHATQRPDRAAPPANLGI